MKILDEDNDYFLHDFDKKADEEPKGADADPEKPAQESKPEETDAPEEQPRREFSFDDNQTPVKPRRRLKRRLWWILLALVAVLLGAFYVRYFVPHTQECRIRGFVTQVEKRGIFFKTYEGEMISESQLVDTARIYQRDVTFSIPDDSLGRKVQAYQGTGRPVVITTEKYYGTLPWRGASTQILTDITPAD